MNKSVIFISVVGGALLGAATVWWLAPRSSGNTDGGTSSEPEPLYWVAPMDPNYQRDKPGKSPMGMDLIPVYAEDQQGPDSGPGAVSISPEVVNNLGVRTAPAEQAPLETEINTVGYVHYNEDKLIHLHPRVEGWIEKLYIKAEGDPVAAGEPVYDLYAPALVNAQEEYLLALERNNQRLISAASERLRALQLAEKTIDRLRRTRQVQQTVTLYSPQDGVVDNLNIREGFYVQPGTTLMSIGALDEVWVGAEVFERQAALVEAGAPVTMTLDYLPGRTWQGQVDYVYPTLDAETRTIKLRMRFANPDRVLKPNMFAQVSIQARGETSGLLIPREALIRTGNSDRVVLALGDGRFKSINVKVGRVTPDKVEILDGLRAGEKVVTSAQFLLDSESAKSSDFKRMHHQSQNQADASRQADVMGIINSLDQEQRVMNISREAIPKWNRGPATMDFQVSEAVDMTALKPGMSIHFVFEITPQREFLVTVVHPMDGNVGGGSGAHDSMDHSNHEGMNHD